MGNAVPIVIARLLSVLATRPGISDPRRGPKRRRPERRRPKRHVISLDHFEELPRRDCQNSENPSVTRDPKQREKENHYMKVRGNLGREKENGKKRGG